jgi:signal peptidase I
MNYLKIVISWAGMLVVMIIIGIVIRQLPGCRRVTLGEQPTLVRYEKYQNVGLDARIGIRDLEFEDIVCYRIGDKENDRCLVGFVVGLPGDLISIRERRVCRNNVPFERTRMVSASLPDRPPVVVPIDHVYVVGDFPSKDSVEFGPIPMAAIRGSVGVGALFR